MSTKKDLPAIAGGTPLKNTPYGTGKRYGKEELRQLKEALEQGSLFYAHGKKVKQLEKDMAAKLGARFAVATSSGTASIHAALIAAGISPGDEVITCPITDMGTIIPILFQGAVPVFADVHPTTHAMLPESVEARITRKTRAVLAVHLWGNACNLKAIKAICNRKGLILIEDCAQAWGCTYGNKHVGTHGQMGCFSLNEFKHISCGDGGIVVTNDANLARRLRLATDKGYSREPGGTRRDTAFLCNNYRMTELQGAVAVAQLPKLDSIVRRRRAWCGKLISALKAVKGITPPMPTPGCNPSWWFFMFRVQPNVLNVNADEFARALQAEGVPASAHYIGQCVYTYPLFTDHSTFERGRHPFAARSYRKGLCPHAEAILDTAVKIEINQNYTATDLDQTAKALARVARWFRDGKRKDRG